MSVRAKVRCTSKNLSTYTKADGSTVTAAQVSFCAVYKAKGGEGKDQYHQAVEENKIFGEATPSLNLTMFIVNQAAHDQFEIDGEYYLDFTPVPTE